ATTYAQRSTGRTPHPPSDRHGTSPTPHRSPAPEPARWHAPPWGPRHSGAAPDRREHYLRRGQRSPDTPTGNVLLWPVRGSAAPPRPLTSGAARSLLGLSSPLRGHRHRLRAFIGVDVV